MYTIKDCRIKSGLDVNVLAFKMGVSTEGYLDFEEYKEEMSIAQGLKFSSITNSPIDKIIFFKN